MFHKSLINNIVRFFQRDLSQHSTYQIIAVPTRRAQLVTRVIVFEGVSPCSLLASAFPSASTFPLSLRADPNGEARADSTPYPLPGRCRSARRSERSRHIGHAPRVRPRHNAGCLRRRTADSQAIRNPGAVFLVLTGTPRGPELATLLAGICSLTLGDRLAPSLNQAVTGQWERPGTQKVSAPRALGSWIRPDGFAAAAVRSGYRLISPNAGKDTMRARGSARDAVE